MVDKKSMGNQKYHLVYAESKRKKVLVVVLVDNHAKKESVFVFECISFELLRFRCCCCVDSGRSLPMHGE
jgi:hypothetical protein